MIFSAGWISHAMGPSPELSIEFWGQNFGGWLYFPVAQFICISPPLHLHIAPLASLIGNEELKLFFSRAVGG